MNSAFAALTMRDSDSSPQTPRRIATRSQPQTIGLDIADFVFVPVPGAAISDEERADRFAHSAIEKKLIALGIAFHEEYARDLDAGSRAGVERFVRSTRMASLPTLGAESTGKVIATWRSEAGALSIEFVDRLRFNYALVTHGDNGTRRHWGGAFALTFFDEQPLAKRFAAA